MHQSLIFYSLFTVIILHDVIHIKQLERRHEATKESVNGGMLVQRH
jgi:hypothetical protein